MGIKLVGVKRTNDGKISHVLTNGGDLITIDEAMDLVHSGKVDSITDLAPDGTWQIESSAGTGIHMSENNLDILPEV